MNLRVAEIALLSICVPLPLFGQIGPVQLEIQPANPIVLTGTQQPLLARRGFRGVAAGPDINSSANWSSSDNSIATVAANGILATAGKAGSVTITARSGPFRGSTTVLIASSLPSLNSITVLPVSESLALGLGLQLRAFGQLADGTTHEITGLVAWGSSDTNRAVVNSAGLVSTIAVGPVTITASAGGTSGMSQLNVLPAALSYLTVQPQSSTLLLGNTLPLMVLGHYTDGSTKDLTASASWLSLDQTILTVNSAGVAAGVGTGSVSVLASVGGLSASASITVASIYQVGSRWFIRSLNGTDLCEVGIETQWGGSIVEFSLNGTNFVNDHDNGREIQVALYDNKPQPPNCPSCTGADGWDPVQGGDKYGHGSPVLAMSTVGNVLYTKAQPYHWNPDNNGGSPTQPAPSDVYLEQWLSPVTGVPRTFKLHYRITHFGTDSHGPAEAEFPAVYLNYGYDQLVRYGGNSPWTYAPVSVATLTDYPNPVPYEGASETWQALLGSSSQGITVFTPNQFPLTLGVTFPFDIASNDYTNYMRPITATFLQPQSTLESDVYIIAGDYPPARQTVDQLRQVAVPNIFSIFGNNDTPNANSTVSGMVDVSGWAFDSTLSASTIEIYVDGVKAGNAIYGSARPDVANVYPGALNVGYDFSLNTKAYTNGAHNLLIRVIDTANKGQDLPTLSVTFSN